MRISCQIDIRLKKDQLLSNLQYIQLSIIYWTVIECDDIFSIFDNFIFTSKWAITYKTAIFTEMFSYSAEKYLLYVMKTSLKLAT